MHERRPLCVWRRLERILSKGLNMSRQTGPRNRDPEKAIRKPSWREAHALALRQIKDA